MTKLTGAALDRVVANTMGLKSVHNCEKWGEHMTKDEALQMCLEYIETNAHERRHVRWAIKVALAEPDERTWVGLTDEETAECFEAKVISDRLKADAKRIEAKLKEKNT